MRINGQEVPTYGSFHPGATKKGPMMEMFTAACGMLFGLLAVAGIDLLVCAPFALAVSGLTMLPLSLWQGSLGVLAYGCAMLVVGGGISYGLYRTLNLKPFFFTAIQDLRKPDCNGVQRITPVIVLIISSIIVSAETYGFGTMMQGWAYTTEQRLKLK